MTWEFHYDNRYYSLDFKTRVIQITGDSAVGKSLMYQDLQHCLNMGAIRAEEEELVLININQNRLLNAEQRQPFKFIVIDNADLIITPAIADEIVASTLAGRNYWVLLGNEPLDCVSSNSVGRLRREEREGRHYFSIDYS
jgi:hypothetical protein